jgi:sigma-B regulation protein RsbQ
MKHILLIAVFAFALACGGSPQDASPPAAPAGPPAGPGIATAPDGVSIAYTVFGKGSPALVFIHGWMCDQTYWAAQEASFSETHTVVTIDLAGHGKSGMEREGWPLMALGADVEAVVEALDLDRVILVGHSMGGPVVLEAARLMPDRVIGVVGVDTLQDADFKYDPEEVAPLLAEFESDFPSTCRGLVASMFPEGADPVLVERIAADMSAGPPEIGIALLRGYIENDAVATFTAVPAAIPIRCINSTMHATNVEGNRAYHEDFDVVTMDGVGHFLMIERPQEFNAVLEQVVAAISQPR